MTPESFRVNYLDILLLVRNETDLPATTVKKVADSLFKKIFHRLESGAFVQISNYGKFYLEYATADERVPKNLIGHATNFDPDQVKPRAYVRWKSTRTREIKFNKAIGLERDEPPPLSI